MSNEEKKELIGVAMPVFAGIKIDWFEIKDGKTIIFLRPNPDTKRSAIEVIDNRKKVRELVTEDARVKNGAEGRSREDIDADFMEAFPLPAKVFLYSKPEIGYTEKKFMLEDVDGEQKTDLMFSFQRAQNQGAEGTFHIDNALVSISREGKDQKSGTRFKIWASVTGPRQQLMIGKVSMREDGVTITRVFLREKRVVSPVEYMRKNPETEVASLEQLKQQAKDEMGQEFAIKEDEFKTQIAGLESGLAQKNQKCAALEEEKNLLLQQIESLREEVERQKTKEDQNPSTAEVPKKLLHAEEPAMVTPEKSFNCICNKRLKIKKAESSIGCPECGQQYEFREKTAPLVDEVAATI